MTKFQIAKTIWLSVLADEGLLVPGSDPPQMQLAVSANDLGQPRRIGRNASLWITVQGSAADTPVFIQSVYEVTLPEDHPTRKLYKTFSTSRREPLNIALNI